MMIKNGKVYKSYKQRAEAAEARVADLSEYNREQDEAIKTLRAERDNLFHALRDVDRYLCALAENKSITLKATHTETIAVLVAEHDEQATRIIELEATAAAYKIGNDELKRIIETLRTERNEAWSSLKREETSTDIAAAIRARSNGRK